MIHSIYIINLFRPYYLTTAHTIRSPWILSSEGTIDLLSSETYDLPEWAPDGLVTDS